ncbi:MAG: hypothetical protein ACK5VI_00095 [Opitutia bacterium]|jgi:hypothetical protein
MSDRAKLVGAVGEADADAALRLLGDLPLCALVEAADAAGQDWPEWARAAAILQRWTEARGVDADGRRKLGYLSCAAEASKPVPAAMRPGLSRSVEDFLSTHGFDPSA